jgi:hypothetical protein
VNNPLITYRNQSDWRYWPEKVSPAIRQLYQPEVNLPSRNNWVSISALDEKARSNNQGLVDAVNANLQSISSIVQIPNRTAVVSYLSRYPDLINVVADMAGETSLVCPAAELTLQYQLDIESDEEDLALFVRYASYPSGFLRTLESINDKYDAQLRSSPGLFMVMTDYQIPKR